ncbi:alpha-amylase family protein [Limibacter armeniacum]|uniref:alpha-amylase family protein n=1 Tax=Limibacter armeniacum TaxID=466084 RepID=UPI002FE611B9
MKLINKRVLVFIAVCLLFGGCNTEKKESVLVMEQMQKETPEDHKIIIYQMMTRLFGNTNSTNKPWGTLEENGVGKFDHINDAALKSIKDLGASHVWYTGVLEHAVCTDYTKFGIQLDDADVVKGRAGSPYAIKDYYDVNPDLAIDVKNRKAEFMSLVKRTHDNGLKVLIDFVPNHVARAYHSDAKPENVKDFGETDNTSLAFDPQNNFYYIPGEPFKVPEGYTPLGDTSFPTKDGKFDENPAKVSGNGAAVSQPSVNDWFETVRLNYGVDHVGDGTKHFEPVPSTWEKCRQILAYWAEQGVDGFRCDMAEMVPSEFWGWVIPKIQEVNPEIIFIAEIYNPNAYNEYIDQGKFDYLYDKVGMYDSLRAVMENRQGASAKHFTKVWKDLDGVNNHMLRFLENHDEQRIASEEFAGSAIKGRPAMVVSATLNSGPVMVYFGQEVGEPGRGESGFGGDDGRTTIFDYWGVPEHQKWVNDHKYDGGQLSDEQKELRAFYKQLLNVTKNSEVFKTGKLYDLQADHKNAEGFNADRQYIYIRYTGKERVLVVTNFMGESVSPSINIPEALIKEMGLTVGKVKAEELLTGKELEFELGKGSKLEIPAYGALMLKF